MRAYVQDVVTPAARAVVDAARELVRSRRWFLELPAERDLPNAMQATLERAVRALDAAEADRSRG
ncbi:hypothetical protein PUR29_25795 [Methylobacterium ajmalii]|uniref:Uncharacterized protein n=2 Tax=Methylobacterium TaxID=407 RepID=A0A0J6RWK9_9HYPH|nr:hypothetical protein [Methylobacterium aquaticum]KMO25663.1 hypothetical protein VP06_32605 [Methylobacterium aquaticum]